jgi:hypothetical protein
MLFLEQLIWLSIDKFGEINWEVFLSYLHVLQFSNVFVYYLVLVVHLMIIGYICLPLETLLSYRKEDSCDRKR